MSSVSPVGTLAYIIDEQALLVRVNNGWQYIAVSTSLVFNYFQNKSDILKLSNNHNSS